MEDNILKKQNFEEKNLENEKNGDKKPENKKSEDKKLITVKTEMNESVLKDYYKSNHLTKLSIIFTIFGAVFLIGYIITEVLSIEDFDYLLGSGIFVFSVGLGLLLMSKYNMKKMSDKKFANQYEFDEHFINISTCQNNEVVGTLKLYYKDIKKVKENDKYILLYINFLSAFIIEKVNASAEEIEKIKDILKANGKIITK